MEIHSKKPKSVRHKSYEKKELENILNGKKKVMMPYYLNSELPDPRFLKFRLFIHNRKPNEVQHDLNFFEPMLSNPQRKKPTRSLSAYRRNKIYNQKKKEYIDQFTNGSVVIDEPIEEDIANSSIRRHFEGVKIDKAMRIHNLIDKALRQKKKKIESSSQRLSSGGTGSNSRNTYSQRFSSL